MMPLERRELEWLLNDVDWSEVYYIDPVIHFNPLDISALFTKGIEKIRHPKPTDSVSMITFEIKSKSRWNGQEWISRVRSFLEISKRDNEWFWVKDRDPNVDTFDQVYRCDGFLGLKKLLEQLKFLKTEDNDDEIGFA